MPKCIDIDRLTCDALIEMMEYRAVSSIRVTDLTRFANLSRSTFYLHFGGIDDVVEMIEDECVEGFIDEQKCINLGLRRIRGAEGESPQVQAMKSNAVCLRRHSKAFRVLLGPNGDPVFADKLTERVRRWLAEVTFGSHAAPATHELNLMIEYMIGGTLAFYRYAALHPEECGDHDLAEVCARIADQLIPVLRGPVASGAPMVH